MRICLLPTPPPPSLCVRSTLGANRYAASKYDLAGRLLAGTIAGREYADFLTNLCYDHVLTPVGSARL